MAGELPCGCWELNPVPLQEQLVLLTAQPLSVFSVVFLRSLKSQSPLASPFVARDTAFRLKQCNKAIIFKNKIRRAIGQNHEGDL